MWFNIALRNNLHGVAFLEPFFAYWRILNWIFEVFQRDWQKCDVEVKWSWPRISFPGQVAPGRKLGPKHKGEKCVHGGDCENIEFSEFAVECWTRSKTMLKALPTLYIFTCDEQVSGRHGLITNVSRLHTLQCFMNVDIAYIRDYQVTTLATTFVWYFIWMHQISTVDSMCVESWMCGTGCLLVFVCTMTYRYRRWYRFWNCW